MLSSPIATLIARNGTLLTVHRLMRSDMASLQRFNTELSPATRSVFLPHAYDDATVARMVERNTKGHDRAYLLRHKLDVVGYFFLWEFNQPMPILGIGLTDAWHGQGLGEPMMRLLIADAQAARRDGIELTTVPGNERAFRLYRKFGFTHAGDVDNVAGDGRVVREHRMFLALKPGATPTTRAFKPPVAGSASAEGRPREPTA